MAKMAAEWLTSAEARKRLRISTCDLAHLREGGIIRTEKRGNAFYYSVRDIESLRGKKTPGRAGYCRLDSDSVEP